MKRPENNNWIDNALTEALGAEKSEPNFEKWQQDHPEAVEMLTSQAGQQSSAPRHVHKIRHIILKSRITKLAAAAVVVIVVWLGVVLLDKSVPSAYAIEQTIEALRGISTVHVIGTNWDGHRFESWCKVNPETGRSEWVCIDETPHGYKIASTPKGSCVWDKDGNVVRYSNQAIASNDFRYGYAFEELSNRMNNPSDDEKINIYREKDSVTGKEVIVIWAVTKMQDYKVYIDPITKLPFRMHFDRADNMQQMCKSADQIFYNVELPEGMFDFEVPQKWIRDYSLIDDPEKGISAEGLSRKQASVKIAREYWYALIEGDWDYVSQLRPLGNWKNDYRKDRPAELIDIKVPYPERGCSGLVVPCVVRFVDGKVMEVELVVNYRQINGQTSTIIVATWGWPKVLEVK